MNREDVVEIGYFQKPHGYKGQVGLTLTFNGEVLFGKLKFLLLDINNLLTPFFIEHIDHKHKVLVKFENCNSEAEAKKFQGKKVFVPKDLVVKGEEEELQEYIGYTLIDVSTGELGKIDGIEPMPGNEMFIIHKNGKEILLPIIEDLVEEIDEEKKTILYNAPEGLIDMYLE